MSLDLAPISSLLINLLPSSLLPTSFFPYMAGMIHYDPPSNAHDLYELIGEFVENGKHIPMVEAMNVCEIIFERLTTEGLISNENKLNLTAERLNAPVVLNKVNLKGGEAGGVDLFLGQEKFIFLDENKVTDVLKMKKRERDEKKQRDAYESHLIELEHVRKKLPPTVVLHHKEPIGKKDLLIDNLTLVVGGRNLLENTSFKLSPGRKYGLIGRNGIGKTSLLSALARGDFDKFTKGYQILLVEQEVQADEKSALQSVLECDTLRAELMHEEKELSKTLNEGVKDGASRIAEIYKELEEIDAYGAEARACTILGGLGFTNDMLYLPTNRLSGGWRMRVALARALFVQPDILLLDEPTNHLDLDAVMWLEDYLVNWRGIVVVVSHAREFLNVVCSDIIHFFNLKLTYYRGNYESFDRTRKQDITQQNKQAESQKMKIEHMQSFIDKFRYNAKRASLVQSRIKVLQKMEVVEEIIEDPSCIFIFPTPDKLRPPLLKIEDGLFGYNEKLLLLKNLNFGIDMESRVAIVGANGVGKSTFLKLLMGELQLLEGSQFRHSRLRVSLFTQHHIDQLDLVLSPLEQFAQTYPGSSSESYRSHLGSFGVTGDMALRPMYLLSGGQKSRVAFALTIWKNPHILIMDEPTNHLDLDAVNALIIALNNFTGGVLIVSHDQHLVASVCESIWYIKDLKLKRFNGDFEDYRRALATGKLGDSGASQLTRASRATKIGSRAGRVVRLIRLIRIVKIWKSIKTNQEKKHQSGHHAHRMSTQKIDKKKISPNLRILENDDNRLSIQSSSQNSPIYSRISNVLPPLNQPPSQFNLKIHPIIDSTLPPSSPDALLEPPLTPQKGPKHSFVVPNRDTFVGGPLPLEITEEDEEVPVDKESRVGKRLSELTTKRVVILVLVLIFCVPLFQSNYYFDPEPGVSMGIQIIYDMSVNSVSKSTIENTAKDFISMNKANYPLIYLKVPSVPGMIYKSMEPSELRTDEKLEVVLTSQLFEGDFYVVADAREKAKKNAILGITRTIFVSLVLSLGAMFFSKDANDLALRPIERMIEKVNKIARNPLASKEEIVSSGSGYETTIIENAIIKIGALLALGFGDAGSEIIASNMAKGGDVDPMSAGKRKCAVFGFCDIRSFTDATEVLQEEVMVFVNSIAEIVHKTVDKFAGAANKNIGDAFLLVYKFPEEMVTALPGGVLELKRCRTTKNIADMSLISFLKIIAGINRKPSVLKYRTNEKLCLRMPGYKVKMGFGLHFGWAIEGAIGSEFKIDASYLSPNVNMASRLEAATKQYGVPLLISNELHNILSKKTQRVCREIDRVTVKGSKKPIGLYTVDTDISKMERAIDKGYSKATLKAKHKEKKQLIKENTVSNATNSELIKSNGFFDTDKDLLLLCQNALGSFRNTFSEAFEHYIRGDWPLAKEKLEDGLKEREDDGPTQTLLSVMREFGGRAPEDWKGFRVLTDK